MDLDLDGRVNFEEFCTYSKSKTKSVSLDKLKVLFKILDKNKNGFIDELEFTQNFVDKYFQGIGNIFGYK